MPQADCGDPAEQLAERLDARIPSASGEAPQPRPAAAPQAPPTSTSPKRPTSVVCRRNIMFWQHNFIPLLRRVCRRQGRVRHLTHVARLAAHRGHARRRGARLAAPPRARACSLVGARMGRRCSRARAGQARGRDRRRSAADGRGGNRIEPVLDVRGIGYGPRAMLPKEGVPRPDPPRPKRGLWSGSGARSVSQQARRRFLGRSICCAASSEKKSSRWAVER